MDRFQHALEGVSELHGFERSKAEGIGIHTIEGVVHDDPWAAIALGDHPQGTEAEIGEVLH